MQLLANYWRLYCRSRQIYRFEDCSRRVTLAVARKLNDFVKFPQAQQEKDEIKEGFYELGGFPCVLDVLTVFSLFYARRHGENQVFFYL